MLILYCFLNTDTYRSRNAHELRNTSSETGVDENAFLISCTITVWFIHFTYHLFFCFTNLLLPLKGIGTEKPKKQKSKEKRALFLFSNCCSGLVIQLDDYLVDRFFLYVCFLDKSVIRFLLSCTFGAEFHLKCTQ